MHELSIAISIVDTVLKQAEAASAGPVSEVNLDIGVFSGIEFESLKFSLDVATKGSILEKTVFNIHRVEAVAECPTCHHLYTPERVFSHCPECSQPGIRLIRGTELQIKSLLVEQNE
ncbi:MAG: hydrogenase maturation nickel metallochaperone HypA [Bacteroidia bacterium]|nr:MAG: hydrogenase maturation nickel metallochaperone HypA [Bacteroidia bacterium]